jgi:hypothetical protein
MAQLKRCVTSRTEALPCRNIDLDAASDCKSSEGDPES